VNFRQRAAAAIPTVQGYIGAGFGGTWNMSISSIASSTDGILFGSGCSSPTAYMCADLSPFVDKGVTPGYGQVYAGTRCIIKVLPANIATITGWAGFTQNEKNAVVYNLLKHEISHCAGLGHLNTAGDLLFPSYQTIYKTQDVALTAAEIFLANDYAP
jgi:hypothetical protein